MVWSTLFFTHVHKMVVEWSCTCLVQKLGQHQLESFCLLIDNVIRILKKRARGMSCHAHLIFFCVFGAAEKSHWAEKNTEKVEGNCTGFSTEFFGSQWVEIFCFARETTIQMLTTSSWSLTRIQQQTSSLRRLYSRQCFDEISSSGFLRDSFSDESTIQNVES